GALTKVVCNFVLVGIPKVNIYGAVVGTVLFYVVIVSFNFISLLRITKVKINWGSVFGKPFVCAVLCGVTAFVTNSLLNKFIPFVAGKLLGVIGESDILTTIASGNTTESILNAGTVSALAAVALAAVVYGITLLLIKGLAREDVSVLPKGEKIAKTLEKYGLLG
ncbi:MAG: polysaccharide biosynthesis C-terminal domain-containing protein, partial [Acutalibacteraceae bacterium]|nr:polysaccharide biosynthesis C-terminal domain-containing protein [Acutalibacteraceae bacterium]